MDYQKVLEEVVKIVEKVGAFQLEAKKNQSFSVETKGDDIDYVTDIDRQSEDMIVGMIHDLYPSHSILAEETGVQDKSSDYTWVIDPIDGTTNFVHNYPLHCISIGLKYKNVRVLGLVDLPAVQMRFTAIKDEGAYLNGQAIHVSKTKTLLRSIIATGFPYFRKENNINLPVFNRIVNEVSGIRRSGSAAVDCCFTAAGMVDGYWEYALNEWDICAGLLIIEEAGGVFTETVEGDIPLLIAGNPMIHEALTKAIAHSI